MEKPLQFSGDGDAGSAGRIAHRWVLHFWFKKIEIASTVLVPRKPVPSFPHVHGNARRAVWLLIFSSVFFFDKRRAGGFCFLVVRVQAICCFGSLRYPVGRRHSFTKDFVLWHFLKWLKIISFPPDQQTKRRHPSRTKLSDTGVRHHHATTTTRWRQTIRCCCFFLRWRQRQWFWNIQRQVVVFVIIIIVITVILKSNSFGTWGATKATSISDLRRYFNIQGHRTATRATTNGRERKLVQPNGLRTIQTRM